jgi:WD40 repeat protein
MSTRLFLFDLPVDGGTIDPDIGYLMTASGDSSMAKAAAQGALRFGLWKPWIRLLLLVLFENHTLVSAQDQRGPEAKVNNRQFPILTMTGHAGEVYTVAFSPDGKFLVSASNREVKCWESSTGRQIFTQPTRGTNVFGLAYSPDGKRLAVGVSHQVRIVDAASGKETQTLNSQPHFLFRMAFSPDGTRLAAARGSMNDTGDVLLWDVPTGKEVFCLRGNPNCVLNLAFSRDGHFLACVSGGTRTSKPGDVTVWDVRAGRQVLAISGHADNAYGVTFTPDGRYIASSSGVRGSNTPGELKLWEVLTGKETLSLPGHAGPIFCVVFSPGGPYLASAGADQVIRVWDVSTGGLILTLSGHTGPVYSLAFSPDGQQIASAGGDSKVMLWDLAGIKKESEMRPIKGSSAQIEALWVDLSSQDAAKAYVALWTLSTTPEHTLAFLKTHLHATKPLDVRQQKRLARLLLDLDDNSFAVREKATEELKLLGEAALPALQRAVTGTPPPEVRRRIEQLLEQEAKEVPSCERLQNLRAVEVLEKIGTPEACRLLEELASGIPGGRLTQEVNSALGRLAKHRSAKP